VEIFQGGVSHAGGNIRAAQGNGTFECGFDCYDVPVGTDKYITAELMATAEEIVADAEKAKLARLNEQLLGH
jgi:hypothetical protein